MKSPYSQQLRRVVQVFDRAPVVVLAGVWNGISLLYVLRDDAGELLGRLPTVINFANFGLFQDCMLTVSGDVQNTNPRFLAQRALSSFPVRVFTSHSSKSPARHWIAYSCTSSSAGDSVRPLSAHDWGSDRFSVSSFHRHFNFFGPVFPRWYLLLIVGFSQPLEKHKIRSVSPL